MIRITTIVENSAGEHKALRNEHGISFHIENGGDPLLFDTGQSDALIHNATRLHLDLGRVRRVVLSHGHYDHTGGLRSLAALNSDFDLVTGKGFFAEKFGKLGAAACEYLGNDFDAQWLANSGIAHVTVSHPVQQVAPGIHAITDFPRVHLDEVINPRFALRIDGAFVADKFDDEVMLAVDTPRGLVALVGCSHPGIKNMLDATAERLGQPIHAVLGGTHLVEASPDSLALTLAYLDQKGIQVIGASHCTGTVASERLAAFGERYYPNRTGTALFFE